MYVLYTTMLINLLKTEQDIWDSQIDKNLRTDIRKALNNGVTITLSPSPQEIASAYALYLKMMKKNLLPVERSYTLGDTATKKIIVSTYEWKVISYIQFQLFSKIDRLGKTKVCALETIASDDTYKNLSWNALLYREWIKYMKSLWFEYLNFNGVSYQFWWSEFNSLSFFKRKWNGIEIECVSRKSIFNYMYRRYFRRCRMIKKMVYRILTNFFNSYMKY